MNVRMVRTFETETTRQTVTKVLDLVTVLRRNIAPRWLIGRATP